MTATTKARPKRETKMDVIERLITRKRGASETELSQATSWTPHSLTGGLSRIRTKGTLSIRSEKDDRRGRVFFASPAGADDTGGHVNQA